MPHISQARSTPRFRDDTLYKEFHAYQSQSIVHYRALMEQPVPTSCDSNNAGQCIPIFHKTYFMVASHRDDSEPPVRNRAFFEAASSISLLAHTFSSCMYLPSNIAACSNVAIRSGKREANTGGHEPSRHRAGPIRSIPTNLDVPKNTFNDRSFLDAACLRRILVITYGLSTLRLHQT